MVLQVQECGASICLCLLEGLITVAQTWVTCLGEGIQETCKLLTDSAETVLVLQEWPHVPGRGLLGYLAPLPKGSYVAQHLWGHAVASAAV